MLQFSNDESYVDLDEVAEATGINIGTLRQWATTDVIPSTTHPRTGRLMVPQQVLATYQRMAHEAEAMAMSPGELETWIRQESTTPLPQRTRGTGGRPKSHPDAARRRTWR